MRSTLAAAFNFTSLSLITLAAAGQMGADHCCSELVPPGALAGRRFHRSLERGWRRPADLVFASMTAAAPLARAVS